MGPLLIRAGRRQGVRLVRVGECGLEPKVLARARARSRRQTSSVLADRNRVRLFLSVKISGFFGTGEFRCVSVGFVVFSG